MYILKYIRWTLSENIVILLTATMRDKQGRAAILKLKTIKLRYMRKMTGCVTFIRP